MVTILWDIDGTLVSTGGAGMHAMRTAMQNAFGVPPEDTVVPFAGRTDRAIVGDFFRLYQVSDSKERFEQYTSTFLVHLEQTLPTRQGRVLPGVEPLLEQLAGHSQVRMGLLTGNLREAARMKLTHYGLQRFFYNGQDAFGGFGDIHADRCDVAREALRSANARYGAAVDPATVWVIGDTPHDVRCARAVGANVCAVATGDSTLDELVATDPDLAVDSLSDTQRVVEAVLAERN